MSRKALSGHVWLVVSHLVPAAAYKSAQGLQVGTAVVVRHKAFFKSEQVKAPFLCQDCEQKFHRRGEDDVLAQSYQPDGQFKLRELLQAARPLESRREGAVYDVQLLLGKIEVVEQNWLVAAIIRDFLVFPFLVFCKLR
jgi:hypothetical protein